MRKVVEYTLISADGVFESPQNWGALGFRDEAYLRDGLGLLRGAIAGQRLVKVGTDQDVFLIKPVVQHGLRFGRAESAAPDPPQGISNCNHSGCGSLASL